MIERATESHLNYTDSDGNSFALVYMPYQKGNRACQGCAFITGNSAACRAAKSCTPTNGNGNRLVGAGYAWERICV